jgi:uncharacterized protein (TIGR02217 family)
MGFHEVQFPDSPNYGSEGGPSFNTTVVESDSGIDFRASRWDTPRQKYDISFETREYNDLATVIAFFNARQGAVYGFRFKDPMDYTSNSDGRSAHTKDDQNIGTGDASETQFQLRKQYTSGAVTRNRDVHKPVSGTVLIALDGVNQPSGWSVNTTTGIVTFDTAPGAGVEVTAGFEFDVPVRFEEGTDEWLRMSHDDFGSGSIRSIRLVEIVNPEAQSDELWMGGSAAISLTGDTTITELDGRVLTVTPDASGHKLYLPDATDLALGGPYFYIKNGSGSYTINLVNALGAAVVTIATSAMVEVVLGEDDSDVKTWYVMG